VAGRRKQPTMQREMREIEDFKRFLAEGKTELAEATLKLYAFRQYQAAIQHMKNAGKVVPMPEQGITVVVFSDAAFKDWERGGYSAYRLNGGGV
jgi:hypothetical protein